MDNHLELIEGLHKNATEAGINFKHLSKLLCVSRTSLFKYRRGEWKPSDETLQRMQELNAKICAAIYTGQLPAVVPTAEEVIQKALDTTSDH